MKNLTTKIILLAIIISTIFFTFPVNNIALAAEGSTYEHYATGWEIIPYECINPNGTDKKCDLNSFIQLFVNLSNIMLKLITPLAMIIIIYGGYQFITARGKQEQIQSGKKVLSGVFIGMVIIVFGGWIISYFVVQTLVGGFGKDKETSLFNSPDYAMWKTEWWSPNGSDGDNIIPSASVGCCLLAKSGCLQTTQTICTSTNPDANWTKNTNCDDKTICKNIKEDLKFPTPPLIRTFSCCKPILTAPTNLKTTCYSPNSQTGCLEYRYTEQSANLCGLIPNCETIN